MKITDIKQNEKNPRHISQDKLDKLKKSVKGFEKMLAVRPIIVDETNTIIGGNQRYKALLELGYTDLKDNWVKRIEGLTEQEKQEIIVKDNISYGYWEWDKVEANYAEFDLKDWGMDTPFQFEKIDSFEEPIVNQVTKNVTINNNYGVGVQPKNDLEGREPSLEYENKMEQIMNDITNEDIDNYNEEDELEKGTEEILCGDIKTTKYITLTLEENEVESFKDFFGVEPIKRILELKDMKKII